MWLILHKSQERNLRQLSSTGMGSWARPALSYWSCSVRGPGPGGQVGGSLLVSLFLFHTLVSISCASPTMSAPNRTTLQFRSFQSFSPNLLKSDPNSIGLIYLFRPVRPQESEVAAQPVDGLSLAQVDTPWCDPAGRGRHVPGRVQGPCPPPPRQCGWVGRRQLSRGCSVFLTTDCSERTASSSTIHDPVPRLLVAASV